MTTTKRITLEGRVVATLIGAAPMLVQLEDKRAYPNAAYLEKAPAPEVRVTLEGFEGDRHAGITMIATGHTPWQPRGTEVRNSRQVTILSEEDLREIADGLGIPCLEAGWLGANLVLAGIPRLSQLPPGTRLFFPDHTTLAVECENHPCIFPGRLIQSHNSDVEDIVKRFPKVAAGRRGLVAWVERTGKIRAGDAVRVEIPPQRLYMLD